MEKALALREAEAIQSDASQNKLQRTIRFLRDQEKEEIASISVCFEQDLARELAAQAKVIAAFATEVCLCAYSISNPPPASNTSVTVRCVASVGAYSTNAEGRHSLHTVRRDRQAARHGEARQPRSESKHPPGVCCAGFVYCRLFETPRLL